MRVKGWRKAFSVIGLATVLAFGALAPVIPGAGAAAAEKSETPEPRSFTQKKSAVINDRRLSYTVTAGETLLKDEK
ncbi:MAG: hypothetical protein ACLFV8_13000, partial [Alphaproteobacteria bacterium]